MGRRTRRHQRTRPGRRRYGFRTGAAGLPALSSGNLIVGLQTADNDVSGQYTDPTSGLAQLPIDPVPVQCLRFAVFAVQL